MGDPSCAGGTLGSTTREQSLDSTVVAHEASLWFVDVGDSISHQTDHSIETRKSRQLPAK